MTVVRTIDSWRRSVARGGTGTSRFIVMLVVLAGLAVPAAQAQTRLPQSAWQLVYVDSFEPAENAYGENAFDGDPTTIWHTEWFSQPGDANDPAHPHEIQIDLAETVTVVGVAVLPRQNLSNGRIGRYELYLSGSTGDWGAPVASGRFANTADEQVVTFPAVSGRYLRLVALDEVNGKPWTTVAELNVLIEESNVPPAGGTGSDLNGLTPVPVSRTTVVFADSEETAAEDGRKERAADGDPGTAWMTEWSGMLGTGDDPPPPHEIQLDIGEPAMIGGFRYWPRQDSENGRVDRYEFYVSTDGQNWQGPVASGRFPRGTAEQVITFSPEPGRYVRFVALSEINGRPWTAVGELTVLRSDGVTTASSNVPVAQIESISPDPAVAGQTVTFSGAGQDSDGTVVGYQWRSSIDGELSTAAQFSTAALSPGEHTVEFRVRDDSGLWADPVSRVLSVTSATGGGGVRALST